MDLNISSVEIGAQTLLEIENCEKQNNAANDIIENCEIIEDSDIIENSPHKANVCSFQHRTLSSRIKLATQKQSRMMKTKNDSVISSKKFEISSVSKYINTDSFNDFDFSAWEKSMEKLCSPAPKALNFSKVEKVEEALNPEHVGTVENENFDTDNITFIESQSEALYKLDNVDLAGDNESVLIKSRASFLQNTHNSLILDTTKNLEYVSNWNLPESVVYQYRKKGLEKMFKWQTECLQNEKVLFESANLVYSAPTSAGKTLVSEILMIKNIIERKSKALFILPFVSLVREKIYFLQELLASSKVRVDGFYGGYHPPRGFDNLDLIVCTIEKANSIVNRLLEQNKLSELGMIVTDEIHLISDASRGYILELLLTKVLFMCQKYNYKIQLISMSATLPNVELLCKWLDAEYYFTNYRPIELREMIKIDKNIYNSNMNLIREVKNEWSAYFANDSDDICELVMETIMDNCQLIIFCPAKEWCEQLATNIARGFYKMLNEIPDKLDGIIDKARTAFIAQQGKSLATGMDQMLERCLTYGSAFHHAGLTTDERELVEMGFKEGIIKVLVATSTLSSGVNLPARRVIIRTPMFGSKVMNNLTYRQMCGRAGRKGKDILGESILVCNKSNARSGQELIATALKPISSSLDADDYAHFKRALLEIISSGMACTRDELESFVTKTLYCQQHSVDFSYLKTSDEDFKKFVESKTLGKDIYQEKCGKEKDSDPIKNALNFLFEYSFIRLHDDDEGEMKFVPTRLGMACLSSSMPPKDGFLLFQELQKARQNFVLESDLHALYLVTPFSVAYQLQQIDWTYFFDLYDKLPADQKRVAQMVGVSDTFLIKAITGRENSDWYVQQVHKRFYTALALQELVNEEPISNVSLKYKIPRGLLQSLQQSASTFAAILTTFCQSLQWNLLVLILQQFRERLFFGIHPDLIDLMKIPSITSTRMARALYNGGMQSLTDVANASKLKIEDILLSTADSQDGKFFMSGKSIDITVQELAKIIISDAQHYLKNELGLRNVQWSEVKVDAEQNVIPERSIIQRSERKRKHENEIRAVNNDSITRTPKSKKININNSIEHREKLHISNQFESILNDSDNNMSLFQNPEITYSPVKKCDADLITKFINIIDVLSDKAIFEKFLKETNRKGEMSLSIGVERIQAKTLIGGKLLAKTSQKSEIDGKKFIIHEKFYIACVCMCYESNQVYFLDLQNAEKNFSDCGKMLLQKLLARQDVTLNIYDARDHLKILNFAEIRKMDNINAKIYDPRLACWMLDPDKNLNWTEMLTKFSPHNLKLLELVASNRAVSSLGLNHKSNVECKLRCAAECYLVNELAKELTKIMNKNSQERRLLKVLENLEMPIQKSLAKMEFNGFPVNKDKLNQMIDDCVTLQRNLENYIFQLYGRRFDIANTKEVAKVLNIAKSQEKKTVSTAKNVLAKLDIPIAEYISTYRTLAKTVGNIRPMTKLITNNRIYSRSFSLTQTGRISMHEPNLQNVAKDFHVEYCDSNGKRFKELVSFRSAFQCKRGKLIIAADFCQLELRILSHLCKDPNLVNIMKHSGEDIFRKIAAKWNHIDEDKVTSVQRNQTKQLCYGIIYGMGNKALADQMKVDEETALKITGEFHAAYPSIRQYTEKILNKAKQQGYIETVTCRRRYLPAINSTDSGERSKAERQALNSTIQGSASDLVKNAILRMQKVIQKKSLDCQLVMHLHDELFYEICESDCREIVKLLTVSMERCVELNVPLKVKVKTGHNWGELKEFDIT